MRSNKLTRLLALLLSFLMVLSMAACGDKNNEEQNDKQQGSTEQSSEENSEELAENGKIPVDYFAGTELTIAIVKSTQDNSESYDEKPIVQLAEEATGIHINWIEYDEAVASEQVDTLLAGGKLPDAMMGMISTSNSYGNSELFYDLSEEGLLETWAPDIYDDYVNGGQNIFDMITTPDGSIYNLAGNIGSSYSDDFRNIWLINVKWLEQLDMNIPTNADEFYEVLCAFRDNDMDGDGDATNEIPISFCDAANFGFLNYANAFGIAGTSESATSYYYKISDGTVEPTMDTEAYRDFLEYFHMLKEEGLLDIEGFSQTGDQYNSKLASGRVGVYINYNSSAVEDVTDYDGMIPFQGIDGVQPRKTGMRNGFTGSTSALSISADCSNVEAVLHWFNYISSTTELKCIARMGEENIGWHLEEGGKYINKPGDDSGIDWETYNQYHYDAGLYHDATPYRTPGEMFPKLVEGNARHDILDDLEPYILDTDEYISTRIIESEKNEERTFIETDLKAMISSFMANSVVDGVTDESWSNYLEELETYGYYKWIEWWQNYLDGTL